MKKEFLGLMYCGMFVDTSKLDKGIYERDMPCMYSLDSTIEGIVEQGKLLKDITGLPFLSDSYFENLKKCELVKFTLTQNN